jgi:hypothetical protein
VLRGLTGGFIEDRFRIFADKIEGEFQCLEISPHAFLGAEQGGKSRRRIGDALLGPFSPHAGLQKR